MQQGLLISEMWIVVNMMNISQIILLEIRLDWTGEPPGEFTNNATAFTFLKLKAFDNESDNSLRFKLFLLPNLPSGEIIPDNLIKAIIGVFEKNNILPFLLI